MVIANVAVALASTVVIPAVTYLAFRRLIGAAPGDKLSEPRTTPFGMSALLIFCVLVIYAAGFYATRPFDSLSPFISMFLPCMLVIEIYIRRRSAYGYVVGGIFGVAVIVGVGSLIKTWLRH